MSSSKAQRVGLTNESLAQWIVSEHFERFSEATVVDMAEAYVGLYSNRPTSWLAFLARNQSSELTTAIAMETAPSVVRVPGMRRSKFLLPQSLAATVFAATRLALIKHEWRLQEVGLTLADYQKMLPELIEITSKGPVQLKDIGAALGLIGSQASILTTVATYDGALIRVPSSNLWSNRWLYVAAADEFLSALELNMDLEKCQQAIADRYIEHYGPVSIDDLAWWLAVSKKTARALIAGSGAKEFLPGMWISPTRQERLELHISHPSKAPSTEVRFLPAWDPLLMGYSPGSQQRQCLGLDLIGGFDSAGNGRPVVMLGGQAVATWKSSLSGSKRSISLEHTHCSENQRKVIEAATSVWAEKIGVNYNR
ncbi:hypothetical protein Sden_0629 [Shewanella denitrificans OS217]|uniref:Winged helix DNA-binding domain-containing protein n=1 Tax=Shewanella denitrificans (strain OS217 / ATCC BAA-1090 / DSM 15013) TaxID=318161 RepID=Q12RK7_SHEDO|nr:crosslink repair DNA glycosylase YcaQ family protein [Shewanella denitrificans]ABE53919.1 hypothetical protein Sden_0629 [Shewanella denitrificans OS217]